MLTMTACRYVNRVPKTSYCAAEAPPRKESRTMASVPSRRAATSSLGVALRDCVAHDIGRVAAGRLRADPGLRRGRLRPSATLRLAVDVDVCLPRRPPVVVATRRSSLLNQCDIFPGAKTLVP